MEYLFKRNRTKEENVSFIRASIFHPKNNSGTFHIRMNPPDIPEKWEEVPPDQLKAIRAKAEAYYEWISDPKKAGAKRQLSAILKPLWQVQDAITEISEIILG